ncbi:hypothetical protein C8034_v002462 [Colletotrichum sidae]|uniref:Uncharacterized protein n=1 Tax=Colletotrichum sidae TaxID=1347389 RepID=A0A4R8TDZ5_9PEZI|nr:hypothetical protein C8034_v002462 [Colletotrichum sidae]
MIGLTLRLGARNPSGNSVYLYQSIRQVHQVTIASHRLPAYKSQGRESSHPRTQNQTDESSPLRDSTISVAVAGVGMHRTRFPARCFTTLIGFGRLSRQQRTWSPEFLGRSWPPGRWREAPRREVELPSSIRRYCALPASACSDLEVLPAFECRNPRACPQGATRYNMTWLLRLHANFEACFLDIEHGRKLYDFDVARIEAQPPSHLTNDPTVIWPQKPQDCVLAMQSPPSETITKRETAQ